MPDFIGNARLIVRAARELAESMIRNRPIESQPRITAGARRYAQPLRLIPGMSSAPEPCPLPRHWEREKHPWDAAAQPKVDGIRALYIDTSIVSREALPLDCALHCLPALHDLEQLYGEPMVFDGEYLEPDGFQATLAAMRAGEGVGAIWLFDAVPYREWKANRFSERLDRRVEKLCKLEERLGSPFVRSLGLTFVPDPDQAIDLAEREWARGGEGLVIKSRGSVYERGKTSTWLKLKKRQTFDGPVVDALVKDGRCIAIMVKLPEESPTPGKVARVGSNIPEELREAIARAPEQFLGSYVEVGFNDTTESGALRGGYFIRLRDDKTGARHD